MPIAYRTPKTNMFAVDPRSDHKPQQESRAIDWTLVRRARPLDRLLPATQRWANSLPEPLRPHELVNAYPRIANRLAIAWTDSRAAIEVLDDVLIDRRGGRRGLPPSVLAEVLRLRSMVSGS